MDTVAQIFTKLTCELNFPMLPVTAAVGERREGPAHHEPGELLYFDDVRYFEPGHEA